MVGLRAFLVALLVAALGIGLAKPARAQLDPVVLGHAVDATVQLSIVVNGVVDGKEQIIWYAVGSGSIVSPDGLILTNQHLITPAGIDEKLAELEAQLAAEGKQAQLDVDPERFMVAISDGRHLPEPRYDALVVASDPDLDLAVLRVDGDARGGPLDTASLNLPAFPLGDSDTVNLGDPVHVFGFPGIGSGSLTYTSGVVSGFLFEEAIDGTAWINTDAVTSGGNSGGSALNDAGELIGIPSSGSELDCRPGDTNRDGVIGPDDVGCIPTGGSLTQLRPIDLAKPLLASVDASIVGKVGAGAAADLNSAPDSSTENVVAAEGCAARGDWRCAANFYGDALAGAPEDGAILGALYNAYLALGHQEAAAGRLDSARSAFASAQDIDPARVDASQALDAIAPYKRAITIDDFAGRERFVETDEADASSAYEGDAFVLDIRRPGLVSGYPLTQDPLHGENFAAVLRIGEATGDGMVTFETHTDPTGGQWVFAVDPGAQTWEVLQYQADDGQFMPWAGPFAYGNKDAAGELSSVELHVKEGFPLLLINGVDVAAAAKTLLPEIGNEGTIDFGALMTSEGSEPFHVAFDEIALYELN
jgi:S1-C subfamily serine protease